MNTIKKLDKYSKYPVFAVTEDYNDLSTEILKYLKHQAKQSDLYKARLLLNPSYHDAKQASIFVAWKGGKFSEKKFPFLPWMELEILEGEIELRQSYENKNETTRLNSNSDPLRFDPAVFHSYSILSDVAVFKIRSIGPFLESLVSRRLDSKTRRPSKNYLPLQP